MNWPALLVFPLALLLPTGCLPPAANTPQPTATSNGVSGGGDRDRDGIADGVDQCPDTTEDRDAFEDGDGCPEHDNDADGIADEDDLCPNAAETFDGVEDDDGCPEPRPSAD